VEIEAVDLTFLLPLKQKSQKSWLFDFSLKEIFNIFPSLFTLTIMTASGLLVSLIRESAAGYDQLFFMVFSTSIW